MNIRSFRVALAIAAGMTGQAVSAQEPAAAAVGPFAADNFSASLALSNQYMFRGISNTDGPAISGSLDWEHAGFFVGVWASNTEFSDANIELNYYGGYRWSWNALDFTLQGIWYHFPGEEENFSEGYDPGFGVESDYGELNVGVAHTFQGQLSPTVSVDYYYSPDTFGEDGDSHTVEGNFSFTLPADFGVYGLVAYNDVEGDKSSGAQGGVDYVYYAVGVNKEIMGFVLDLGYHGTNESDSLALFYPDAPIGGGDNFRDLIEGYVVFTVSRTF